MSADPFTEDELARIEESLGEDGPPMFDRVYRCPCCSLELDRDHNSSLNILALGLQSAGLRPWEAARAKARAEQSLLGLKDARAAAKEIFDSLTDDDGACDFQYEISKKYRWLSPDLTDEDFEETEE